MDRLAVAALLGALGLVGPGASVCQADEAGGDAMARAAETFLNSLNAEQRDRAAFAFDAEERFNWQYMRDRADKPRFKGLALKDMTAGQKKAAIDLLATATSAAG